MACIAWKATMDPCTQHWVTKPGMVVELQPTMSTLSWCHVPSLPTRIMQLVMHDACGDTYQQACLQFKHFNANFMLTFVSNRFHAF